VIAYSTCIAHGIEMSTSMTHQKDAVRSGYWPLYRFHPTVEEVGEPLTLDSREPPSRSPSSSTPRCASRPLPAAIQTAPVT